MRALGSGCDLVAAVALAMAAVLFGCDVEGPEGERSQCIEDRIHHGVEGSVALGLDAEQLAAIVAVYPTDRETICSGVVVAEGVVVTAGHCVDPEALDELRVGTWEPRDFSVDVLRAQIHPSLDVAVVWVEPGSMPEALEPIPLLEDEIDEGWIGELAELAGYGSTEFGEIGQLRFAAEPIVAVEADAVVVHGRGRSGACGGDSGGPLLARDDAGRVRVVGVLDSGHASCVQDDRYTRVDALADWWSFDWRASGSHEQGCEGLDAEGTCVRGRAMRCIDGQRIEVERCGPTQHCGQQAGEPRFTCVDAIQDVCEGQGALPWCEGDLRMRCEGGYLEQTDCGVCGGTCVAWTPAGGAACAVP